MKYVVGAKVKVPLFSQSSGGKETLSYQVKKAMPLPLPTALLGALARAYSLWKMQQGQTICARVFRHGIDIGYTVIDELNRKVIPTAKLPENSVVVQNSLLLRRVLIFARDKREIKNDYLRMLKGESPSDAMLREYMFSDELIILFLTEDYEVAQEIENCLWLFERLGDTESLGSVVEVQKTDEITTVTAEEEYVNTVFPHEFASRFSGGLVVIGANGICFSSFGTGEAKYVLPLRREKVPGYGVWLYKNTSVKVLPANGVEIWKFKLFGEEIKSLWKRDVNFLFV